MPAEDIETVPRGKFSSFCRRAKERPKRLSLRHSGISWDPGPPSTVTRDPNCCAFGQGVTLQGGGAAHLLQCEKAVGQVLDEGEEIGYPEFLLEGKRPRTAERAESVRAGTRPERMEVDRSEEAGRGRGPFVL